MPKPKLPIVSTTEELAYPWWNEKALSKKIDAAARKARVAVVGTGVNRVHDDALPITLTGVCQDVTAIAVQLHRGRALRAPAVPAEDRLRLDAHRVQARVDAGTVRHVGLTESIATIAGAMAGNREGDRSDQARHQPERDLQSAATVVAGACAG